MVKRIFSVLMAALMVLGTMGTVAFAEESAAGFVVDSTAKTAEISDLAGLKSFAESVNGGETYAGYTVSLTADINANNEEWTPIGTSSNKFKGIFDGQNKTISNLKITHPGGQVVKNGVGLFGYTAGATVKNLVVENVDITGSGSVAAVVGNFYTGSVSDVTVKGNIKITGYQYVGSIFGWGYGKVNNCNVIGDGVSTSVIKKVAKDEIYGTGTNGYVGGVVGWIGEGNSVISNCSVKDVTLTTNDDTVGGISGILHYGNTFENCAIADTSIIAPDNDTWNGIIAGDIRTSAGAINNYSVSVNNVTATADGVALPALGHGGAAAIVDDSTGMLSGSVYHSLSDAVENAEAGDTITLLNNTTETVEMPDGVSLDKNGFSAANVSGGTVVVATVGSASYSSLKDAFDAVDTEGGTIEILADVDFTGVTEWSYIFKSDNPTIINGNGHKITNLTLPLVSSTYSMEKFEINDLTIEKSSIAYDVEDTTNGGKGVGAFIGEASTSDFITLNNCHVVDSTVEGGHWTGGLIGYAAGYSGTDGPVFEVLTIKNCSVKNSTVKGKGSAGGIIGHGTGDPWTMLVIENTTVSGNDIISTGSSNVKAGSICGTVGCAGPAQTTNGTTLKGGFTVDAQVSGNTVTSNGTEITTIYGRQGSVGGILEITGGTYDKKPLSDSDAFAIVSEGFELVENADGTYTVEEFDAINAETSFDGGKYADGTAAVVFNTFFKDHATLDKNLSYGVFLYKQGNATGTKVSLEKGISEDGFISVIVDAIPAESQDDYIVCVPYTVSGDVLTAGVTTTVKASDLTKNLVK